MTKYVISVVEITEAHNSVDGKRHRHKYYLYPVPKRLADLGFKTYWSYKNGKRGALRFDSPKEARKIALYHGAKVEEVSDES